MNRVFNRNFFFPIVKLILDIVTIVWAVYFSYYVRFYSPVKAVFPVTKGIPEIYGYFYFMLLLLLFYLVILSMLHSYQTRAFYSFAQEITIILKSSFFIILFAMSSAFLYRGFSYSRLVFVLIFFNTTFFMLIQRYIFHLYTSHLLKKGYGVLNMYIIGSPGLVKELF